jgi:hypothetical protein
MAEERAVGDLAGGVSHGPYEPAGEHLAAGAVSKPVSGSFDVPNRLRCEVMGPPHSAALRRRASLASTRAIISSAVR